jgi:hypothetical protein
MTDTKPEKTTTKKPARMQHVVVQLLPGGAAGTAFDDMLVFGQEIDALRHIIGKPDWRYVAVPHGASVAEALKAAGS